MMGPGGFWCLEAPLVLASGSAARRQMLEACAIPIDVVRPELDESKIAARLVKDGLSPSGIATALAQAKAAHVAQQRPTALVLAADQTLELDGGLMMKPRSRRNALDQLLALRGRPHVLHVAATLHRGTTTLWAETASAHLWMRDFSEGFLKAYLDAMGDEVLDTVGGYKLEALGIQLFDRVEGDQATILGLPLMAVLRGLRDQGALLA